MKHPRLNNFDTELVPIPIPIPIAIGIIGRRMIIVDVLQKASLWDLWDMWPKHKIKNLK